MPRKELARKVMRHLKARELGKKSYKEAEQFLDEIVQSARPGQAITLPGGRKAVLKDLYAETNKVFRAHGIGRYEIEVVEA